MEPLGSVRYIYLGWSH